MPTSTPQSVVMTTARTSRLPTIGGKYFALAVLFVMNTLNYVDRYAFFAVSTPIERDLHIDDYWFGWLGAAFMIVYTAVAPFTGWLGDRFNRKLLIFSGVGLWSLATVGAALSGDFYHMFFWRALLGNRRGQLRRDRAGPAGGPLSGERAGPGDGGLLPGSAGRHGVGIRHGRRPSPSTWAGGLFSGSSACPDFWPHLPRLSFSDPGRGASEVSGTKVKTARPGHGRLSRTDQDKDICLQYSRHGSGDFRDGRLRRLGFRILPAHSRSDDWMRPASESASCWLEPA